MTQEYKQYATYKTYVTDNSVHADHGSTVIQDSFNQDNDGIDLKGATVDDSVLAGHDANQSGNARRLHDEPGVVQRRPLDVGDRRTTTPTTTPTSATTTARTTARTRTTTTTRLSTTGHSDVRPDHAAAAAADDGGDALGVHHA